MTPDQQDPAERWHLVRSLFEQALERAPAERDPFIAGSGAAADVQHEVRTLLAHADAATLPAAAPADPADRAGQRLGAWQIRRLIGRGGMGEVFEARRADGQFDARAAVKVLKRGLDSRSVLARFAQEQRLLARLNHPHIARLFDAGTTGDGLPYFVMEYVDGRPIDAAVQGQPLAQRLRWFLQLADAVAFAHRNLLVHRDLKPGNVLVDAEQRVKLLDFGIAKALDPADADGDPTLGAQRAFTPRYASPEQVRGETAGTATDVYSLGVLLYQMLTGERPYGRTAATPVEVAQAVLSEEPAPPSSALDRSARGQLDAGWIAHRKALEGDLDNVLLKALEKDPEARYLSVDAFAADIRAFLDGRPVDARPRSTAYVLRKFVQRHRVPVVLGALAVAGTLGGLAGVLWQAHEARVARDEARARLADARTLARQITLRYADAVAMVPGGLVAQERMLLDLVGKLDAMRAQVPDDRALAGTAAMLHGRLADMLGENQGNTLGKPAEAAHHAALARELAQRAWPEMRGDGPFVSWYSSAVFAQAEALRRAGKLDEALAQLQALLPQLEEAQGAAASDVDAVYLDHARATALIRIAQVYDHTNPPGMKRPADSLRHYEQAEAIYRDLVRQPARVDAVEARDGRVEGTALINQLRHPLGTIAGGRSRIHLRLEQLDAATATAEAAVDTRLLQVDSEPGNVVWRDGLMVEANHLCTVLLRSGDPGRAADALAASTLAWDAAHRLLADNGAQSQWAHALPVLAQNRARALAAVGRHAEALPLFAQGTPPLAAAAASGAPAAVRRLAAFQTQHAASLAAEGRIAEARTLARGAEAALASRVAPAAAPTRDMRLSYAAVAVLLAKIDRQAATAWRELAIVQLDAAAREAPLTGDDARLLAAAR